MNITKSRDGLRSMYDVSRTLCRIVTTFGPFLRSKYAGNVQVLTALEAAEAACTLIVPNLEAELVTGGENDDIPADINNIPGINSFVSPSEPFVPGEGGT